MNRGLATLLILIAVGVALYGAYTWAYPSGTVRYRLTVEVLVDGQIRAGSSVVEVTYALPPRWLLGQSRVVANARGEAAFVDLGSRGMLFVLLEGKPTTTAGGYEADATAIPAREFFQTSVGALSEETIREIGRTEAVADLPIDRTPIMVRVPDPRSTAGAMIVDPGSLATYFGSGVAVQRVSIATTHDPVTRSLDRFPFMTELREAAKIPNIERAGDPFRLNSGMFERGV